MSPKNKKIGLVTPWFGQFCQGGAETISRELAENLKQNGLEIEILTTCVRDFTDNWNHNFYKPGKYQENGLSVKRFRVKPGFHKIFQKIVNSGGALNDAEEKTFIENSVNSPGLYQYLEENQNLYDFFVFIPYLYGTTYFGIQATPEKAVLIGCLHDEPYAYLKIFRQMYQKARALVYLSRPEKELAEKIYQVSQKPNFIGGAVKIPPAGEAEKFRRKFGIPCELVIYSGRREAGKNVPLLISYFLQFKKQNPTDLKLVLSGPESLTLPAEAKNEIIDLGILSPQDKADALAQASLLIQPSVHESFSIVIMEAWINQKPVLVNENCAVTKDFVSLSQGGLYFANYLEFEAALNYLLKNPTVRQKMGQNGRKFVFENLSWEKVITKYLDFLEKI